MNVTKIQERKVSFKNLSISKKLIVGFGIVLILMVLSAVLSLYSINSINQQVESYGQYTLPNNTSIWMIRRDIVSAQRYVARAFTEKDTNSIENMFAQAEEDGKIAVAQLEKYALNQRNTDRDQKISELKTILEQTGAVRKQIMELMKTPTEENRQKAYELFTKQYISDFDQATDILTEFTDAANTRAQQQRAEAKAAARFAWLMLIACTVVSVVLTVIAIMAIRNSILTPVTEIVNVYREISKGDMRAQIKYQSRDELGQMADLIRDSNNMQGAILGDVIEKFTRIANGDLRITVDLDYPGDFVALKEAIVNTAASINHTMYTIDTAAEQVSTGASQVASGAQELAAGSTEQASAVEELNASVEKIAEQAAENLMNVKTASHYIEEAGVGVAAGNEHMNQLTEAMADIGSASSQIANITKVIEDIAFQTNILALNAAIEAARAGNAGKGFAVVADEVRNLAAKSAEAAKQTSDLIEHSVETVSRGAQITAQTAQVLRDVGESAFKVTEGFTKIEYASAEQADAIEQIQQGLTQVSAVIETNAATAEENSATSEEMSAQAVTLREQVGKFKLDTNLDGVLALPRFEDLPQPKKPLPAASNPGKY